MVTTREPNWQNPIKIPVMRASEGQFLVDKLLLRSDPDAGKLAEFLDCLPLAITHSCAYIRQEQISIAKFLKEVPENSNILEQNPINLIIKCLFFFGLACKYWSTKIFLKIYTALNNYYYYLLYFNINFIILQHFIYWFNSQYF